jgi:hypothetical protein
MALFSGFPQAGRKKQQSCYIFCSSYPFTGSGLAPIALFGVVASQLFSAISHLVRHGAGAMGAFSLFAPGLLLFFTICLRLPEYPVNRSLLYVPPKA